MFSEPYKNFLLSMWLQNRLTVDQLDQAKALVKITQEEYDSILNTPRIFV